MGIVGNRTVGNRGSGPAVTPGAAGVLVAAGRVLRLRVRAIYVSKRL